MNSDRQSKGRVFASRSGINCELLIGLLHKQLIQEIKPYIIFLKKNLHTIYTSDFANVGQKKVHGDIGAGGFGDWTERQLNVQHQHTQHTTSPSKVKKK